MGTSDILLGGDPAMDQHPVQGGVAIRLGMPHAKEHREKLRSFRPLKRHSYQYKFFII